MADVRYLRSGPRPESRERKLGRPDWRGSWSRVLGRHDCRLRAADNPETRGASSHDSRLAASPRRRSWASATSRWIGCDFPRCRCFHSRGGFCCPNESEPLKHEVGRAYWRPKPLSTSTETSGGLLRRLAQLQPEDQTTQLRGSTAASHHPLVALLVRSAPTRMTAARLAKCHSRALESLELEVWPLLDELRSVDYDT